MGYSNQGQVTDRRRQGISSALIALLMLLVFAFYANLRWSGQEPAFEKAKATADTPAYMRVAGEAFLSKDFWANTRPPIFPLVLKIFAVNTIKVAPFHTAFSIFSWGTLALAVAYAFNGVLRPIAFGLILLLSLESHFAGWDVVLLTESISISLLALFLAIWLWLLRSWSWGRVVVLSAVAFLWAFTRDTNGWILLMLSGLIVFGIIFFGARKRYLAIAIVFALIFAMSNLSADKGQRWIFPFQNVLAQRILTDQDALAFFVDCGMPITQELLDLAGGYASSNDRAFYTHPALQPYRNWLLESGKACYMRWLISRPFASLSEPWRDFAHLLAFGDVSSFFPQRYQPVLPWFMGRILYPRDGVLYLWALTTLAALTALWKKAWKVNPAWVIFITQCVLIYPHLFIVWHGDVPGTHRHALTIGAQFVLSFWLLGVLVAERILICVRAWLSRQSAKS